MEKTNLHLPQIGIGTWAWGDTRVWGYGKGYTDEDLKAAFDECLREGVRFFDTAELYGRGKSEELLGRFMKEAPAEVTIATKFLPWPWRLTKKRLKAALNKSLKRLGVQQIALYQIHWPIHLVPMRSWMHALADIVASGSTRAVGVSNYSTKQMCKAHSILAKLGVPLFSNQVEYSLLHRKPEHNGLLQACDELGVALIAYSPLAMGMLSGKYSELNRPSGYRGFRYRRDFFTRLPKLIKLLKEIGEAHDVKTPTQVALNWVMRKGAVPIPGVKNAAQARENMGALGWTLTEAEMAALDAVSESLQV